MPSYLERYRSGERESVWSELNALGAEIRSEALHSDALAVAQETMARARTNIETLVERLRTLGYQFAHPREVLLPLSRKERARLNRLERLTGPLPLSLRVFYDRVGSVCLMGSHPKLSRYLKRQDPAALLQSSMAIYARHMGPMPAVPSIQEPARSPFTKLLERLPAQQRSVAQQMAQMSQLLMQQARVAAHEGSYRSTHAGAPSPQFQQRHEMAQELMAAVQHSATNQDAAQGPVSDPLVVWPADDDDLDSYQSDGADGGELEEEDSIPTARYAIVIAPDDFHKAGISGSEPYRVRFPNCAIDAPIEGAEQYGSFVSYLRTCFHFGGFPGMRDQADAPEELAFLTRDLLPI